VIRSHFGMAALACAVASLATAQSAQLSTSDTVLTFEAGEDSPRLLTLSSPGQTSWTNSAPEELIRSAIVDGAEATIHWRFDSAASSSDSRQLTFVYESNSPRLRLFWDWEARQALGPIEHKIRILNLESREIWLSLQPSFQFRWKIAPGLPIEQLFVEKGAETPSDVGTHLAKVATDYDWRGTSSTYAHPQQGELREIIPWFLVEQTQGVKNGWYVGVEFSGRTELRVKRRGDSIEGTAGLNPQPGPFRTRLQPGGSFVTPIIFLGASHGGPDSAGNVLRHWVRVALGNAETWRNPNYPLLVNNSWGGGMNVNEETAGAMIRDAADLGLEMFHQDAGWFRGVGDWYPNPQKFPHGIAALADEAHRQGMKFGLWVDWTQAALDVEPGALNVRDPKVRDWMVTDLPPDWKPEPFKGQTIDIGVPEAKEWAERELERIVSDYHLDMLEHDGYLVAQGCDRADHVHAQPDNWNKRIYKAWGSDWVESSNSTDVSYQAVRAYYEIYSKLRNQHPGLLLEVCNDGGRMVDFGSAAHADYFSITDTYDPLSNRRAFYDASHVLPSAVLESYVEKWPAPRRENFLYMLRSGMMGWLTVMMDTTTWTAQQHAIAKQEFALYKEKLRPLIREADLYHISQRPDGVHWDGIEYYDPKNGQSVVFTFRGSTKRELTHTFTLRGLRPNAVYRLHFQDHSSPDRSATGRELLTRGLSVSLPAPQTSELIFLAMKP
jgi:alpha-galactosidase